MFAWRDASNEARDGGHLARDLDAVAPMQLLVPARICPRWAGVEGGAFTVWALPRWDAELGRKRVELRREAGGGGRRRRRG